MTSTTDKTPPPARRFGVTFWVLTLFAIAVNAFGAVTFDRPAYSRL